MEQLSSRIKQIDPRRGYLYVSNGEVTCDGSILHYIENVIDCDTSLIEDVEQGVSIGNEEPYQKYAKHKEADVYGINITEYHMTFAQIAKEIGVTNERVRQILAKALRKLKHPSRRINFEVVMKSGSYKKRLYDVYLEYTSVMGWGRTINIKESFQIRVNDKEEFKKAIQLYIKRQEEESYSKITINTLLVKNIQVFN